MRTDKTTIVLKCMTVGAQLRSHPILRWLIHKIIFVFPTYRYNRIKPEIIVIDYFDVDLFHFMIWGIHYSVLHPPQVKQTSS